MQDPSNNAQVREEAILGAYSRLLKSGASPRPLGLADLPKNDDFGPALTFFEGQLEALLASSDDLTLDMLQQWYETAGRYSGYEPFSTEGNLSALGRLRVKRKLFVCYHAVVRYHSDQVLANLPAELYELQVTNGAQLKHALRANEEDDVINNWVFSLALRHYMALNVTPTGHGHKLVQVLFDAMKELLAGNKRAALATLAAAVGRRAPGKLTRGQVLKSSVPRDEGSDGGTTDEDEDPSDPPSSPREDSDDEPPYSPEGHVIDQAPAPPRDGDDDKTDDEEEGTPSSSDRSYDDEEGFVDSQPDDASVGAETPHEEGPLIEGEEVPAEKVRE